MVHDLEGEGRHGTLRHVGLEGPPALFPEQNPRDLLNRVHGHAVFYNATGSSRQSIDLPSMADALHHDAIALDRINHSPVTDSQLVNSLEFTA